MLKHFFHSTSTKCICISERCCSRLQPISFFRVYNTAPVVVLFINLRCSTSNSMNMYAAARADEGKLYPFRKRRINKKFWLFVSCKSSITGHNAKIPAGRRKITETVPHYTSKMSEKVKHIRWLVLSLVLISLWTTPGQTRGGESSDCVDVCDTPTS